MASHNTLLRKSSTGRLKQFFTSRAVAPSDDFDWNSAERGTAFVASINELLAAQTDKLQDAVKAELDHLATLADDKGLISAEQICAGQAIDIEPLEGVSDVIMMLAVEHPHLIDRVSAQASLMRQYGGKNWAAFQFEEDGKPWVLNSDDARAGFLAEAVSILDLPTHRKREADWYNVIRLHPITGEEIEILQATIYVEERAESELAFGPTNTLERQIVQKVLEVGLACNPTERVIEICTKGGKKARNEYAKAFAKHFAPDSETPTEMPRRDVQLDRLRAEPSFRIDPADGIERVEVSSLELFATGGGTARFERRGDVETIYQFLDRSFGTSSPLTLAVWQIIAATLRIIVAPSEGKRRRTLTVTLRTPNTTTLPNKTEADRQFSLDLLERWELIAPPNQDEDVVGPQK